MLVAQMIWFIFPFIFHWSRQESNSSKIIVGFRARKHLFNSILSPLQMDYHAEAAGRSWWIIRSVLQHTLAPREGLKRIKKIVTWWWAVRCPLLKEEHSLSHWLFPLFSLIDSPFSLPHSQTNAPDFVSISLEVFSLFVIIKHLIFILPITNSSCG